MNSSQSGNSTFCEEEIQNLVALIGRDEVREMVEKFFSLAKQDLAKSDVALAHNDREAVKKCAHRIAGAALSLSFSGVALLAQKIEGSSRLSKADLDDLSMALVLTRSAVEEWITTKGLG